MSDVSQGPGWWLASDGKWYSPEQSPGPVSPGPEGQAPNLFGTEAPSTIPSGPPGMPPMAPSYGAPPAAPPYGSPPAAPAYGMPPGGAGGYGVPGYGTPAGYPAYGYQPVEKTNGLAIAALVCSLFFFIYGIGAVLGIVFGFIARSQIKRSSGTQKGAGLALAGIIIGISTLVLSVVVIILVVAFVHRHCPNDQCTFDTNPNNG